MRARKKTTEPPVEVELKFQLMPESEAILRADDIFGPAALRVHQITTYHDTPDSLLRAAGLTLRIRDENGDFVQNVKSRDAGTGLASSRLEWEWPVTNGAPDVGKLTGVAELAALAENIADRLEPVIVTDVWRTRRLLELDNGTEAEASLDIGSIVSGDKSEPVCEMELELKHGPMAPLYRIAIRLAATTPMWISAQSKAARGWSLRNAQGCGATTLRKQSIGNDVTAAAGLRQIIGALLGHLTANGAPTLSGDPEALRQMRGALRQLRAVFRLFRPLLNKRDVARYSVSLQQFAQIFGAARDWDVFCLQTLPALMTDLPQHNWTDLLALANAKRTDVHFAVQGAICGQDFTLLILQLALWAETTVAVPPDNETKQLTKRLSDIAPVLLDSFAEKARQAGRHPSRQSMPALHDFRKALDRLNAAIRFLGSTYPAHRVKAYSKRSDAVRDIIGAANDAEVTKALSHDLAADGSAEMLASIKALGTWADQRQDQVLTDLKQAARKFRTASEFWQS